MNASPGRPLFSSTPPHHASFQWAFLPLRINSVSIKIYPSPIHFPLLAKPSQRE
uniref:Uncharacterized protein n=1 Tax=Picea glauca TaxID=3330 RepID=A0A101LY72_PICGL|nr:hypothetical protein ABT39_MTgene5687 [Picea glauca]